MDHSRRSQLRLFLRIKFIQIRLVLEIVGVQVSGIQGHIGLYIIVILFDLQGIACLLQHRLRRLQDLCVGSRAGSYDDGGVLTGIFGTAAG